MKRPSASLIVATLALFVSLGGTGIAATHYLITSKSQIKSSVLAQLKGKAGKTGPPWRDGTDRSSRSYRYRGRSRTAGHARRRTYIAACIAFIPRVHHSPTSGRHGRHPTQCVRHGGNRLHADLRIQSGISPRA